ncbi:uncharacterized protein PSFLO_04741 [Pseudozyma flocculosa]|uniref:Uncharacterized protein n=1 Tax=Pseudozyma flocculosa TaxID=84751 RepID=A0A5C3F7L0_9BASI|nr:uncharacterized protein PSFLO_04741 [Pseudozyma flocculosa]
MLVEDRARPGQASKAADRMQKQASKQATSKSAGQPASQLVARRRGRPVRPAAPVSSLSGRLGQATRATGSQGQARPGRRITRVQAHPTGLFRLPRRASALDLPASLSPPLSGPAVFCRTESESSRLGWPSAVAEMCLDDDDDGDGDDDNGAGHSPPFISCQLSFSRQRATEEEQAVVQRRVDSICYGGCASASTASGPATAGRRDKGPYRPGLAWLGPSFTATQPYVQPEQTGSHDADRTTRVRTSLRRASPALERCRTGAVEMPIDAEGSSATYTADVQRHDDPLHGAGKASARLFTWTSANAPGNAGQMVAVVPGREHADGFEGSRPLLLPVPPSPSLGIDLLSHTGRPGRASKEGDRSKEEHETQIEHMLRTDHRHRCGRGRGESLKL